MSGCNYYTGGVASLRLISLPRVRFSISGINLHARRLLLEVNLYNSIFINAEVCLNSQFTLIYLLSTASVLLPTDEYYDVVAYCLKFLSYSLLEVQETHYWVHSDLKYFEVVRWVNSDKVLYLVTLTVSSWSRVYDSLNTSRHLHILDLAIKFLLDLLVFVTDDWIACSGWLRYWPWLVLLTGSVVLRELYVWLSWRANTSLDCGVVRDLPSSPLFLVIEKLVLRC